MSGSLREVVLYEIFRPGLVEDCLRKEIVKRKKFPENILFHFDIIYPFL